MIHQKMSSDNVIDEYKKHSRPDDFDIPTSCSMHMWDVGNFDVPESCSMHMWDVGNFDVRVGETSPPTSSSASTKETMHLERNPQAPHEQSTVMSDSTKHTFSSGSLYHAELIRRKDMGWSTHPPLTPTIFPLTP